MARWTTPGAPSSRRYLDYPGVPARLRTPDLDAPLVPVVPVTFRHRGQAFRFFSAVTVLGTPQDITVQELRIESFFPLDEATEMAARNLASSAHATGAPRHGGADV